MRPSSVFLVLLSITASLADLVLLPRDGVVTDKDFIGYTNINYHATRYEPLCGSFGSITPDKFFQKPVSEGGQCDQAILQYAKIPDTLAMYDLTGVKLSGAAAIIGNGGDPKCMCFSLAMLSGGSGDICVWVNGDAQTQTIWDFYVEAGLGYIVQSSFKPGSAKALPQCGGDVNVTSLETKWSATAFFDTATTSPTSVATTTSSSGTTTPTGTSTSSTGSSGGTAPPTGDSSTGSQTQSADAVNQSQPPPNGALASTPGGIFSTTALVLVALALTVVPV